MKTIESARISDELCRLKEEEEEEEEDVRGITSSGNSSL